MGQRGAGYRQERTADLSERQREVLRLIAKGYTNAEIGERLGISLDGAKWHVREILVKLGVDSREEAAAWWHAHRSVRRRLGALLGSLPPKALVGAGGVVAVGALAGVAIAIGLAAGDGEKPPLDDATAAMSPTGTVEPSSTPEPNEDLLGDPAIQHILSLNDSSQHVFAMAWDGDERLWFLTTDGDTGAHLRRYDAHTQTHERWQLPADVDAMGPHTYIELGRDGLIWVAANYGIAVFDSTRESFAGSLRLELNAPGATPQRGGTWINGFRRDGERIAFTRENVPALFAIDGSMAVERIEEFDTSPRGLWVTRERLEPYTLDAEGAHIVSTRTEETLVVSGAVSARGDLCYIATGPHGGEVMLVLAFEGQGDAFMPGAATGADVVAVSESGPYAVLGPAIPQPGSEPRLAQGQIVRFDCRDGSAHGFRLPALRQRPDPFSRGPAPRRLGTDGIPQPDDNDIANERYVHHEILAVAVSNQGRVAFSDAAHQVAIIEP